MMVISIQMKKKQWIALAALVLVLGVAVFGLVHHPNAVSASADYALEAETDAQRKAFLGQFGWTVKDDPVEICEVIIPEQFNAVYSDYNAMQQEQGLDLSRYMGKRVKRWTYEITNYPNLTDSTRVYADLLIYDGRVIGGSIGTREADGFMQGFRRNAEQLPLPQSAAAESAAGSSLPPAESGTAESAGASSEGAASSASPTESATGSAAESKAVSSGA